MCGFCGYVLTSRKSTVDFQFMLDKITDILTHRGPDSKGLYHADTEHATVGLGHRRLSIIDLSNNANQPLGNFEDSIMVVFNGEIYNYKQLTKELVQSPLLTKPPPSPCEILPMILYLSRLVFELCEQYAPPPLPSAVL